MIRLRKHAENRLKGVLMSREPFDDPWQATIDEASGRVAEEQMQAACGLELEPDNGGGSLPSAPQTRKRDLPARTTPYYAHLPDLRAGGADGGMKRTSIYINKI